MRDIPENCLKIADQQINHNITARRSRRFPRSIRTEICIPRPCAHLYFSKIPQQASRFVLGARTYGHRAGRKSNSNVPRVARKRDARAAAHQREMKYVNTRDEIPQRMGGSSRDGKSPWVPFPMVSGPAERVSLFLSRYFRSLFIFLSLPELSLSRRPFRPEIESMPRRVSYEAATEDNWILIRFLSRCLVVVAICCAFFPLHSSLSISASVSLSQ